MWGDKLIQSIVVQIHGIEDILYPQGKYLIPMLKACYQLHNVWYSMYDVISYFHNISLTFYLSVWHYSKCMHYVAISIMLACFSVMAELSLTEEMCSGCCEDK